MIQDVQNAFRGLNEQQIQQVMAATKTRVQTAIRLKTEVNQCFVERCLIEFADDLRNKRPLETGWPGVEDLRYERNYADLYSSPRADN